MSAYKPTLFQGIGSLTDVGKGLLEKLGVVLRLYCVTKWARPCSVLILGRMFEQPCYSFYLQKG